MKYNIFENNIPPLPMEWEESDNKPDISLFTPTPLEDSLFPVSATMVNLDTKYLRMFTWHWHEEVEFTIVKSGHVSLKLSNHTFSVNAGEGFFINQNRLHSLRATESGDCMIDVFKFHPSFLFGYGQTNLSVKYLTPLLSSPLLHCIIFKKTDPETAEIFNLITETHALCQAKDYGYELLVKSNLCRVWNLLLPYTQTLSDAASTFTAQSVTDGARVKQAILFIEENHAEPLTLEQIADSIHLSKSECCRCFQRCLGITPFEYLMKYRIFESTRKINRGEEVAKSISALASSVGFNSASYYNKLFKKYLNCTPSEYKKKMKK
ncbi:MAG: helix-turn-helix transcriptional regulator [Lachnospiraceae bacterium]|nr:helix-turn-helix transcriptional regulator [Lachnospiraceae bacterium]